MIAPRLLLSSPPPPPGTFCKPSKSHASHFPPPPHRMQPLPTSCSLATFKQGKTNPGGSSTQRPSQAPRWPFGHWWPLGKPWPVQTAAGNQRGGAYLTGRAMCIACRLQLASPAEAPWEKDLALTAISDHSCLRQLRGMPLHLFKIYLAISVAHMYHTLATRHLRDHLPAYHHLTTFASSLPTSHSFANKKHKNPQLSQLARWIFF